MYKCKECGAEYELKPDYCDCGNDEFEGINEEASKITSAEVDSTHLKHSPSNENTNSAAINNSQKPISADAKIFSAAKENSYIPKRELKIDPISLTIFGFCLLLSLYIIFFAWNRVNQENNQTDTKKQTDFVTKNIPSVDKIWNDALPVIKTEPVKQEKPEPIDTVVNVVKPNISVTKPAAQTKTAVQQKIVPSPKTTLTTQKKTTTANKTSSPSKSVTTSSTNTKAQTTTVDEAKKKAEQERKAAEAEQLKKLQAEQAKKQAEEKSIQTQIAKQEYAVYKANLRNNIARRIDFTRVIGDGSCVLAFKLDSSGRLINRSFAKQSSNNTLNDAVYNAVMSLSSFTTPPAAYNNEVLNLSIKFYNGNFEVSLP